MDSRASLPRPKRRASPRQWRGFECGGGVGPGAGGADAAAGGGVSDDGGSGGGFKGGGGWG